MIHIIYSNYTILRPLPYRYIYFTLNASYIKAINKLKYQYDDEGKW